MASHGRRLYGDTQSPYGTVLQSMCRHMVLLVALYYKVILSENSPILYIEHATIFLCQLHTECIRHFLMQTSEI